MMSELKFEFELSAVDLTGAETIAVPKKGDDGTACYVALADCYGIEVPPYIEDRDERISQGIRFLYAKGVDIPVWVANGWADAGVTGIDSCVEFPRPDLVKAQRIGSPMCRYSLLARQDVDESFIEYKLAEASWNGRRSEPIEIVATRPRLLDASKGDKYRMVQPMDLQVRGSGELAIKRSGAALGADLVQTGNTAQRTGLYEYDVLCEIFPASVVRAK